jgi:benzoyl-CoA reductase/2-hydroxyglutaryl-CoA dehydratase subunit BcrC/BadD/HgdB
MRPRFRAQKALKSLLERYYQNLSAGNRPVAWCSSAGPVEVLRALDFEVYFPENHAALIGAKRLGSQFIPAANQEGYSPDICSYTTGDIGAYLLGKTPLEVYGLDTVPKPDVLVFNTNQCREIKEWFAFYHEVFAVPLVGIHTPRNLDELSPSLIGYLKASWEELIRSLEVISARQLAESRLKEVLSLSDRACSLWQAYLETGERKPAPHTFFDDIILMAPVVVLRGTEEACNFYEELLQEVNGAKPGQIRERLRFYWEGMPIWGKIRYLAELFDEFGISVVASTYCHSWAYSFQGEDPLESLAVNYASIFITRSQAFKLKYLMEKIERFSVDAVLFHDAKTCPYNTNSRFGLPEKLRRHTGKPYLTFNGDLVDLRHFSEEEFRIRLEAFVETL